MDEADCWYSIQAADWNDRRPPDSAGAGGCPDAYKRDLRRGLAGAAGWGHSDDHGQEYVILTVLQISIKINTCS